MDPVLRSLVRQKFPDIPNDTFVEVPLNAWIEMLSFEDQIALVEEMSTQNRGKDVPEMQIVSGLHLLTYGQ